MGGRQGWLFAVRRPPAAQQRRSGPLDAATLSDQLERGHREGWVAARRTVRGRSSGHAIPAYFGEFWTARQRAASSLHEVSYRACFKPALPRWFIERLTAPGEAVHDPFLGRGTTAIEAALLGRRAFGSDINPLSQMLVEPRLAPPEPEAVAIRLDRIDLMAAVSAPDDLTVFFHPDTLRELAALREHLLRRAAAGELDDVDRWIRMVAVNRLTGHSAGFFSVYTMPPNQAVSVAAQRRINARRGQTPEHRSVRELILRKTRSLLADVPAEVRADLRQRAAGHRITTAPAAAQPAFEDGAAALVVTSPPFLDVVQYAADNWLRCWFCGIDAAAVAITRHRRVEAWESAMTAALVELRRIVRPGGHVAFEVGEVRNGSTNLEESVIDCAQEAGLTPAWILVQDHSFTKTANCWGVTNNSKGTNSNRIVLLQRPGVSQEVLPIRACPGPCASSPP